MDFIQLDFTKREQRLGKFVYPKNLRAVRMIVGIWFFTMLLVSMVTLLEWQKVANLTYSAQHAFVGVH